MNVLLMLLVVAHVHDAVKCKASLPNLVSRPEFFANSIGIAAFDKLHRSLQRTGSSRSNQQVDMIWHNDKFVERVLALIAIKDKHLNEEQCVARNAKNSRALIRNSVNEVRLNCSISEFRAKSYHQSYQYLARVSNRCC